MSERGFTLVELLVSLVLAAGAVLTLVTMSTSAFERVGRSGRTTTAVTLSQQRIEWLRSRPFASSDLAAGTTSENLGGGWQGFVRITTIVDGVPLAGLKQVTVSTRTPDGRQVQVSTLIADR